MSRRLEVDLLGEMYATCGFEARLSIIETGTVI
jgi:hypothetical protein